MEKETFPVSSTSILFNQYKDSIEGLDVSNAARIRRNNLHKYFHCFKIKPSILMVAEAPGPWGARFSGVPLTTEEQLCLHGFPFVGEQSSANGPPQPRGISQHAQTAKVFWDVMKPFHPKFIAWNAVPFHPHKENGILLIRNPRTSELWKHKGLLLKMHSVLSPETTIAIGRKAAKALNIIGLSQKEYTQVRHPARGGANKFKEEIGKILEGYLN